MARSLKSSLVYVNPRTAHPELTLTGPVIHHLLQDDPTLSFEFYDAEVECPPAQGKILPQLRQSYPNHIQYRHRSIIRGTFLPMVLMGPFTEDPTGPNRYQRDRQRPRHNSRRRPLRRCSRLLPRRSHNSICARTLLQKEPTRAPDQLI